ncbi:MAG: DUF2203 family protein, partial [Candidatus Bathyarchaeia archaeon]
FFIVPHPFPKVSALTRFFTPEEANRLLPRVQRLILELRDIRASAGYMDTRELRKTEARFHDILEDLQELGCELKDIDLGLVDFPAKRLGKTVSLCWQLGEPNVAIWHGLEGYQGRRPIREEEFEASSLEAESTREETLIDVVNERNHVKVVAELRGAHRHSIHTQVNGRTLTLTAQIGESTFARDVQLPVDVEDRVLDTSYNNGVLQVVLRRRTIPKAAVAL